MALLLYRICYSELQPERILAQLRILAEKHIGDPVDSKSWTYVMVLTGHHQATTRPLQTHAGHPYICSVLKIAVSF